MADCRSAAQLELRGVKRREGAMKLGDQGRSGGSGNGIKWAQFFRSVLIIVIVRY